MRTVAYGAGPEQVADLRVPEGPGPFPVVALLHGGFWLHQYRRDLMDPLAADLTAWGWATWNLEYRRLGRTGGGWPATFLDVAAAMDALAGVDAPLDLARVAVTGHSAGGHLAAWVAGRPRLPAGTPGAGPRVGVIAAVAVAGVLDLAAAIEHRVGGGVAARLLAPDAAVPGDLSSALAVASPAALLPLGVPLGLVHPERDTVVPPWMSTDFATAARRAGDTVELALIPAEDHFAVLDPVSRTWSATVDLLGALAGGDSRASG